MLVIIILYYARRQHKNKKKHSSTKWKIYTSTEEKLKVAGDYRHFHIYLSFTQISLNSSISSCFYNLWQSVRTVRVRWSCYPGFRVHVVILIGRSYGVDWNHINYSAWPHGNKTVEILLTWPCDALLLPRSSNPVYITRLVAVSVIRLMLRSDFSPVKIAF